MAKTKKGAEVIRFLSTGGTGCAYYSLQNFKKNPAKLSFRKYDSKLRKHVVFNAKKA